MITGINNIAYRSSALSFRGFNDETYHIKSENKMDWTLHQTAFFRDIESLNYVKNHLENEFPRGTNIVDFGCSNGEETYTMMMLMKDKNADKRYQFKGYDLSEKVLQIAKGGPYQTRYLMEEGMIEKDPLDEAKKPLKTLFFECFETVPSAYFKFLTKEERVILEEKLSLEKSLDKQIRLNCIKYLSSRFGDYYPNKTYMPKADFVDGVVEFNLGDINDIDKIIPQNGKTGVIIFKNAWYHIHGHWGSHDFDDNKVPQLEKIIKTAHKVLPDKGLFVVGNLKNDHVCENAKKRYIYQNGERIKIYEGTELGNLLKKNGFKPVFYQELSGLNQQYGEKDADMHLPSVWQKI